MTSPDFDKEKAEPDIVDNRAHTMADVLNLNLGRIGFLDVSSGYFEVSGYGAVRGTLERAVSRDSFTFRLLVGKDALKPPTFSTFEEYRRNEGGIPETLKSSLDADDLDANRRGDIASLICLLRRDNVHVRLGRSRFNHAKCYILGQEGVVIGSSNFTAAGLSGNDELNAGIFVTPTWKKARDWYEKMWSTAMDAKAEMLAVLEQSKFGVPASPYDVYLKMLFEKYRRALTAMDEMDGEESGPSHMPKFQQDAVSVILQTMSEHGGAMLADSTGLGKTHIGLEVMRRKMAEKRRILLIAPAQVRDTVWESRLDDVQIRARTIGTEELGRRDFDVFKYQKYDFVVIDESQNFRSRTTGRRQNLMKLLSLGRRKEVLLLSATPVNNSLMDLYYQVSIITGGRDDHFADMGIPNLYDYMKRAANHRIDEGLEKIQLLLETIMVRRTRTFIRDVYPNETLDGKPITFPKRTYRPIKYGMTEQYGNIYQNLLDTVESLHMTPYGIDMYDRTLTDEERRRHKVLAHLQVILLLKRFESSISAITASLKNKIRLFEHFGGLLDKGRIVSPRDLNRVMLKWNTREMEGDADESEPDEEFLKEVMGLPVQNAGNHDTGLMAKHVRSDLRLLRGYLKSLGEAREDDRKAAAVADAIVKDGSLETGGRKVLVFTEYTATARYVKGYLEKMFPDKAVGLITGSMRKADRPGIIRAFSPISNAPEGGPTQDREIDILVSTEVISEGQNLQDCNYVVNYDLPWNPMRLVQRIGRIDRLTSRYETVHSRECFPDEKLDELLKLMGKLYGKIGDINDTVGLDADLLGQEASPKNFQGTAARRLRTLAGDGDSDEVTDALERESDLMPPSSPFNEISRHIRKEGIMKMDAFPMGRRAGKAGEGNRAVLAYVREGPRRKFHSVVFDISNETAEVVDDMEAIRLARCGEGEEPHLPVDGEESFRMLVEMDGAARDAISKKNSEDEKIAAKIRSKPKAVEKIIEEFREAVDAAVDAGHITEPEAEEADSILDSADMRQWGDYLRMLLAECGTMDGVRRAIRDLKRIGRDMAAKEGEAQAGAEPGRLVLVGALFITGPDWLGFGAKHDGLAGQPRRDA